MASNEEDFHLRVRKKFAERLYGGVPAGHIEFDDNGKPIQYDMNGKPVEFEFPKFGSTGPPPTRLRTTVENTLWLVAGAVAFYLTDFPIAAWYDPRVNRGWFNLGVLLIGINVTIALFLVFWLSKIRKVPADDWEKHYPAAIPIATAAFAVGAFCVTVGLWPLWSFLTPVVLFTLFMCFLILVTMLPNWF